MDKTIKFLYIKMYAKGVKDYSMLFRYPQTASFIRKYAAFGSTLYFRGLEAKSKEAREEWGRHAVHHTRNIRNVRHKK